MAKKRNRSTDARELRRQEAEREQRKEQEAEVERERQLDQAELDLKAGLAFDFEEISLRQSREIASVQANIYAAFNLEDPDERDDALEDAYSKMREWLALTIRYVPLDWFVSEFRATHDENGNKPNFADPDIYEYLKDIRQSRLLNAMNVAREDASKN
jgi:hypothetical protein